MAVRKKLDILGPALVFVTTSVNNWLPIFKNETVADTLVRQLKESLEYFQTSLVGYVLMPSHLHLLMGFREIEKLSRFMQSFKILSSKAIKEIIPVSHRERLTVNGGFRLWKPRFDSFIISIERQLRIKLEYIHNNPVKAGFADAACDWKFSSASDWLAGKNGSLPIDMESSWVK